MEFTKVDIKNANIRLKSYIYYYLVEKLIEENLTHWLPGKELTKVLKDQRYSFEDDGCAFHKTSLGERIHVIMKTNTQDLHPNDRIV